MQRNAFAQDFGDYYQKDANQRTEKDALEAIVKSKFKHPDVYHVLMNSYVKYVDGLKLEPEEKQFALFVSFSEFS